jgi:GNAT superfamily N-acetyltransferase
MRIVTPAPLDLPRVASLWRPTFAFHHALDPVYYAPDSAGLAAQLERYLSEVLGSGGKQLRVALDEADEPIGLIIFWEDSEPYFDTNIRRFVFVSELFVAADARGRGVGQALMQVAEDYARARGHSDLRLNVSTYNAPAAKLYARLGYVDRQRILFKALD